MKKVLLALTMSLSALMLTTAVNAAPDFDDERRMDHPRYNKDKKVRDQSPDAEERRRQREERGVKRLQQMKWQPGYVMPQHYRSNGYKVEYKDHNLPKPERKQQWYKINSDYILINSDSNSIVKILND